MSTSEDISNRCQKLYWPAAMESNSIQSNQNGCGSHFLRLSSKNTHCLLVFMPCVVPALTE